MAQKLRTISGFGNYSDQQLIATAGGVVKGMTGNKSFPSPPVDPAAVQTGIDELVAAIAAQVDGGPSATAAKNNKRDALIGMLQRLAAYVQHNCNNNLELLLSSGFSAATVTRTRAPLDKPSIIGIDNGNSSQLIVKVTPIDKARCYELHSAAIGAGGTPGPWQNNGVFTNTRAMIVDGFTPGTTYAIRVRAVGGSTRYSDWSDPVAHIST